jgi:hypothetical protein
LRVLLLKKRLALYARQCNDGAATGFQVSQRCHHVRIRSRTHGDVQIVDGGAAWIDRQAAKIIAKIVCIDSLKCYRPEYFLAKLDANLADWFAVRSVTHDRNLNVWTHAVGHQLARRRGALRCDHYKA